MTSPAGVGPLLICQSSVSIGWWFPYATTVVVCVRLISLLVFFQIVFSTVSLVVLILWICTTSALNLRHSLIIPSDCLLLLAVDGALVLVFEMSFTLDGGCTHMTLKSLLVHF